MKVIDSDIFIDALRGEESARHFLEAVIDKEDGAFSAVTESELLSGKECNDPEKRESLLHLLSFFAKIPVDNLLAQVAGDFRRKYGISITDALIAASAYRTSGILVTRNTRDFSPVKEVRVEAPY